MNLLDFAKTVLNWSNSTLFWQNLVNKIRNSKPLEMNLLDFAKTVSNWSNSTLFWQNLVNEIKIFKGFLNEFTRFCQNSVEGPI